jgi:hypothetical protein
MNAATPTTDPAQARSFLRHTLDTLAYRAGKALRGAPEGFAAFRPAEGSRSAVEILAHMGDLFDWALSMARGRETWNNATPLAWEAEQVRFFAALLAFDEYLAGGAELHISPERLFQGPIADALTHTGQIAQLRRLAGGAVRGENYSRAEIVAGRVGSEPAEPGRG